VSDDPKDPKDPLKARDATVTIFEPVAIKPEWAREALKRTEDALAQQKTAANMAERINAAIAIAEASRQTHVEWRDFINSGGREGIGYAGDLSHHVSRIMRYDLVLDVLQQTKKLYEALNVAQVTLSHLFQDGVIDSPMAEGDAVRALMIVNEALGIED
jgi:sugar phosphate isomerase/epimerase